MTGIQNMEQIRLSNKSNLFLFFFYILLSVALRFTSFFPSVLDHDESTYMIIGRDILNGKDLYKDVTDTKPVGIFLFYAALQYLFGNSIFWKRMAFAVVVGVTAFLVSKISERIYNNRKVAFASAVIYILYTSIWNYHGRSPNTELLFNLCTAGALLLFFNKNTFSWLAGGIVLGTGFVIKYMVLFDLVAFMLFFFLMEVQESGKLINPKILPRYIAAGLAFLVPFGMVNLWFMMGDHFAEFRFITYELPGRYGTNPSGTRYLIMLLDFTAKFLPISYMIVYVTVKRLKSNPSVFKWFFIIWILADLTAIYLPGREFSHYTIQLMLPLSLIAGLLYLPGMRSDKVTKFIYSRTFGLRTLVLILISVQLISCSNEIKKPDYPRLVAEVIGRNMEKGDRVFVSNYEQIVYYLLGIESPTPFVHSNLLFTPTHKAFNINAEQEIRRIIDTKPRFVVVRRENNLVEDLIQHNYALLKKFEEPGIKIYRLNGQ